MYSYLSKYNYFPLYKENFNEQSSENFCKYVNSIGIMKSCNHYYRNRSSDPTFYPEILNNLQKGDSIYICTTALPSFVTKYLSKIMVPIVLVTGDADETIGTHENVPQFSNGMSVNNSNMASPINNDYIQILLKSPFIIKWFAQNCLLLHEKIVHIPIGIDYHTGFEGDKNPIEQEGTIITIVNSSTHFSNRLEKVYSNFHFALHRGDRTEAYENLNKNIIYYEKESIDRKNCLLNQLEYSFVASPYGRGPDCLRTWEALIIGCIPIVKTSTLDPLFDELPVLLINKWSDVTSELLTNTITSFKNRTFNFNKLLLSYWVEKIKDSGTK